MSSEWTQATLGEVCIKITDGAHASPVSVVSGKPMASVKDLSRFGVDLSSARHISEKDFESLVKQGCRPEVGDVLIAKDGNSALDTVCSVSSPLDAVLLSSVAILRPNPTKIDTDFLKFYLSSCDVIDYLKSTFISGAAIPRVVLRDFRKAEINIPPLSEQKEIVSVLNALESRIFLLRETNSTLEAIAQALFKSWFVDFDPVRAKMAGRAPEGMDEATAALFPDGLEESALGLVPRGWSSCPIYDLATYINGAAYKAFDPNSERNGLPIIKIAELKAGVTSQTAYSAVKMQAKYLIETGDILFSWSGNPDTSIDTFVWHHDRAWLNQHIFRVLPHISNERSFVLQTLKYLRPVFAELARNKQTTGLGHVTVADLKRISIVKPSKSALDLFDRVFTPIHAKIFENEKQAQTLATLRDTLLPRLISGQLRLPEAQDAVAEAVTA